MGLTLAERRAVTETTAIRYSLADKRTKGIILDELCANTGWHRNHARKALKAALASIFRAALDRVGRAGSSQPVALIVACGCDESPDVAPVSGFS